MYGNWLTTSLIFSLSILNSTLGAADPHWPFPWAEKCSVNWSSLQGRYELTQTDVPVHSENVQINEFEMNGKPFLHVMRYNLSQEITYDGSVEISPGQKVVEIYLNVIGGNGDPVKATIRLSYQPGRQSDQCTMIEDVVPTMTIQSRDSKMEGKYRLMRAR